MKQTLWAMRGEYRPRCETRCDRILKYVRDHGAEGPLPETVQLVRFERCEFNRSEFKQTLVDGISDYLKDVYGFEDFSPGFFTAINSLVDAAHLDYGEKCYKPVQTITVKLQDYL